MVILKPDDVVGCSIIIPHLPQLSILQDNHFVPAPDGTSPTSENVARIFDALAVADTSPPLSLSYIPLLPGDPEFQHRYWRLPVKVEAVLVALLERVGSSWSTCEEIRCVQDISNILNLQRLGLSMTAPPDGGGLSSGGRPSGLNEQSSSSPVV
jgi:hypothetical protein